MNWMIRSFGGVLLTCALVGPVAATPSTTFWAPSTPYVQPYGVLHVTYDSYFDDRAAYPVTVGLEAGVIHAKKLQAEVGFDALYPTFSSGEPVGVPLVLNGKLGAPEDAYFKGSPGWSAGIFGLGFEEDVTDYDVLHAMLGKTFPKIGSLSLGGYYGLNENLMRSSTGGANRSGVMAGWLSQGIDIPAIDKLQLAWDVQSGRNVMGATGGGIYVYFTPAIDLLIGPVFFFDHELQPGGAHTLWSVQFDADVSLFAPR